MDGIQSYSNGLQRLRKNRAHADHPDGRYHAHVMLPPPELPSGVAPRTQLHLPDSGRTQLEQLSYAGAPNEACGLLIGERSSMGTRVVEVTTGRNLELKRPRDRFTLDPVHLMAAETDARARGLEVIGIWHSHPGRPAVPSEADRIGAWEDWSYVIVSVRDAHPPEVRSWRLDGSTFVEEVVRAPDGRRQRASAPP